MWKIAESTYGEQAYPQNSHGLEGADKSRFATLILYDSVRNIRLPLFMYLPKNTDTCKKIIFSVHGIKRNANKYRNIFVKHLQDKNTCVVAPALIDNFYQNSLALKMGNMCLGTKQAKMLPESEWTFTHIHEIFQLLRKEFPSLTNFSLFGHSAGAQFAHRMQIFTHYKELDSVVAANPGWLTVMDKTIDFPYGIKAMLSDNRIQDVLGSKLTIMVGSDDVLQDNKLRMAKGALRQGENRFNRAQYAFQAAQELANDMKCDFKWQLVVVPRVAHSSRSIAPSALEYLL